jgi:hypothetical protein
MSCTVSRAYHEAAAVSECTMCSTAKQLTSILKCQDERVNSNEDSSVEAFLRIKLQR